MDENEHTLPELLSEDLEHFFYQLVLCYQDSLYTFALRLSNSRQDAEDIVQEALIGAYVTLSHYPSARIRNLKLRSWLYKLTLNVFRNSKRGSHPLTNSLDLYEENSEVMIREDIEERPDFLYENAECLQEITELLAMLPEHYRVVIICYYFEDLSYQAIASLLNQPLGTIKSRLYRGMHLLRQYVHANILSGRISNEIR